MNSALVATGGSNGAIQEPYQITQQAALSSDLLNVDWGEIYSGNLGRGFGFHNFPERFEQYRETGVVDWKAEERYSGIRQKLQTRGEPDVVKICKYLADSPGQVYVENLFLALPKPRDLPPEDFTKIQDALLDHMSRALSLGKLSTFLEIIHNIGRDYFDDFRLIFDLLPIAIRPDIIQALPTYASCSMNGVVTDNIENIRAEAERVFPGQSEAIVTSILENASLYVSMQCLCSEMGRYRRIPAKSTLLLGVPTLRNEIAEKTHLLTQG